MYTILKLKIFAEMLFIRENNQLYGKSSPRSISRTRIGGLCTCHMMCTCECCTGLGPRDNNFGISGGDAETRRFPVYLALIP